MISSLCASTAAGSLFISLIAGSDARMGLSFTSAWNEHKPEAPVEPVYPTEGTPLITAPSGIFQSAPHPNAARLLQSFLSSLEAQQLLVERSLLL
jgi:hypothetical protein